MVMTHIGADVVEISQSLFMRAIRDVVIPIAMIPFIGIGSWLILDHLALRNEVTVNTQVLASQDRRVELLETLVSANSTNRFTDTDAIRMEQRMIDDLRQIRDRIDRLEGH